MKGSLSLFLFGLLTWGHQVVAKLPSSSMWWSLPGKRKRLDISPERNNVKLYWKSTSVREAGPSSTVSPCGWDSEPSVMKRQMSTRHVHTRGSIEPKQEAATGK